MAHEPIRVAAVTARVRLRGERASGALGGRPLGALVVLVVVGLLLAAALAGTGLSGGHGLGPVPAAPTPQRASLPRAPAVLATKAPPAPPPGPRLYWANNGLTTIGAATLDGRWVQDNLVHGALAPCGVAVDAFHIYWANEQDGSIGRANLDGTAVEPHFITGATSPCGVAVDASHIYWANGGGSIVDAPSIYGPPGVRATPGGTTIGRANLDGSGVNQDFITGALDPCGVAVDAGHIYWANAGGTPKDRAYNALGRANLDGSRVDQRFVTGANGPCGIAVDGTHMYWANGGRPGVAERSARHEWDRRRPGLPLLRWRGPRHRTGQPRRLDRGAGLPDRRQRARDALHLRDRGPALAADLEAVEQGGRHRRNRPEFVRPPGRSKRPECLTLCTGRLKDGSPEEDSSMRPKVLLSAATLAALLPLVGLLAVGSCTS